MKFNNPNHCLYCGKKLSFLHLLRDSLYCYKSHRLAHVRAQNERLSLRFQSDRKSPAVIRWVPRDSRLKTEGLSQSTQ
jgi:hypothetical protein